MHPFDSYPTWMRNICCLVPLACLVALCGAAAIGVQVSYPVVICTFGLVTYVVRTIVRPVQFSALTQPELLEHKDSLRM